MEPGTVIRHLIKSRGAGSIKTYCGITGHAVANVGNRYYTPMLDRKTFEAVEATNRHLAPTCKKCRSITAVITKQANVAIYRGNK